MFHDKKNVDRHVQEILRKLKTEKERNLRCYNIAKLYYQVGDYESARRYVSCYLEVKEDAAGAHKLLGQTLEALGQKEAALAEYKWSLELEGRQEELVLKVCELLADTDVGMDVSRARYWLERAEKQSPHHPVIFQLKEKLLTVDRPSDNAEDLKALITSELSARPLDVTLRVKLLRHYMDKNRLDDAYKHVADTEATHAFRDNILWYQAICDLFVRCKESKRSDWDFWVLYVSSLERFATLSLKEQGDGLKKSIPEAAQAVLNFDQSLTEAELHSKHASDPNFAEHMFGHMWGQLHLHLACLLLRKTKREHRSWSEAGRLCSPLLLCALHTTPPDPTALWATRLKDQRRAQVKLWHREASYRCSQAGHVLEDYARDDTKRFLDKIDKFCTGAWRERVYQRIFVSRVQQQLMKTSYFANHSTPNPPLRLCTHSEMKNFDEVSEEVWPASLHHQVWLGIKSRPLHNHHGNSTGPHPHQYSHIFPELQFSVYNLNHAGADSLSRLDIDAFLNAAVLCASIIVEEQQRSGFWSPDRLPTLPADITNPLCSSTQEKWWTAAYKMYREQEGVGNEIGEVRQILQHGLEVIRCIDNHGLHPCLLVHLARLFHHRVKITKEKNEEHSDIPALEARCELYWSAAVPLLERLQNNQTIRSTGTKLFDYQGKEMNNVELANALEEGRLLLAQRYLREKQHEQAIEALQALKCPEASFQQGQIYKTLADELVSSLPRESLTSEMRSQHIIMLSKARECFYLTLDRLRSPGTNPKHPLNSELCTHISGIENELKRIDPDLWRNDLNRNECDELSDETYSSAHSGEPAVINTSYGLSSNAHKLNTPQRGTHRTPNQSSTPYKPQHQDVLDLSRNRTEARPSPERLDAQIRQLIHSRDNVIQTIMDQNKALLESNKVVVEQLEELKKEVADLRKETQKQRTQPPVINQNIEEDLYVLGEEDYGDLSYGATAASQQQEPASSFPGNIFSPAQRHSAYSTLVYPQPALQGYYGGARPFTDPHIPSLYPPAVYPIPPAWYPPPPVDQKIAPLSKVPDNILQQGLFISRPPYGASDHGYTPEQPIPPIQGQRLDSVKNDVPVTKDTPPSRAPPVNVVITTSDTLPSTAPAVQPTLSVTIPAHHRLGGNSQPQNVPHNYQISMPLQATIPTTVNLPPLSTTLTTTIPTNLSVTEKSSGNTSILSTGLTSDSNDWYVGREHHPVQDFVLSVPTPAEVEKTAAIPEGTNFTQKSIEQSKPTGFTFVQTTQGDPTTATFSFAKSSLPVNTVTNLPVVSSTDTQAVIPTIPSLKVSSEVEPSKNGSTTPISLFPPRTPLRRPHAPAPATLAAAKIAGESMKKPDGSPNQSMTRDIEDKVDDFVPTAEFSPVIALPDIVEVVTGEEGETILFQERAKLLRFDSDTKQWKERGIGQMKILLEPATGKVRLLMRREQVLKVCCNHALLAELKFSFMTNNNKAVSWCALDYSEGEVKQEMFAIRFKTPDQASHFYNVLTSEQKKLAEREATEQAKPNTTNATNVESQAKNNVNKQKSLAEMFKPAAGSWECGSCYTRNDATKSKCLACESPSPNAAQPALAQATAVSKLSSSDGPPITTNQATVSSDKVPLSQLFKPKTGSWECKGCYVVNTSSNDYCVACDSPKDPSMPAKPKTSGFNIASSSASAPAFSFGIPKSAPKDSAGGFTFGIPKSDAKAAGDSTKINDGFMIGSPSTGGGFSFGTPQTLGVAQNREKPFTFGSPGKSFDFQFQAKSPVKSPGGEETSEDEVAESEDVYFAPVIPLPDKVDVKTGEENEAVLYSHRAKLFRYESSTKEWKERGLGDIKLLKHKETGKLRLLMRRDQVLKLCLNHIILPDMEFTPKDDKTWLWYAADYSEGDISHENFACRFKTADIAHDFKLAIDNAKESKETPSEKTASKAITKSPETIKKNLFGRTSSSSDIEIVYEATVTPEEKTAALKLKLPENFYAYKRMPDCPGCIGCNKPDSPLINETTEGSKTEITSKTPVSQPQTETPKPFSNIAIPTKPLIFSTPKLTAPSTISSITAATTLPSSVDPKITSSDSGESKKVVWQKGTGNLFENVSSTTTLSNSMSPKTGFTFSTKPVIALGTLATTSSTPVFGGQTTITSNSIFGGQPEITSNSIFGSGSATVSTPKAGGFGIGPPSSQTNPIVIPSVPNLGTSATTTNVFSFGSTNEKTTDSSSEAKSLDNLEICSPASFTTPTTLPTSNIFAGSGNKVFGNISNTTMQSIFSGTQSATPVFGATALFSNTQNPSGNLFANTFGSTTKTSVTPASTATSTESDQSQLFKGLSSGSVFGTQPQPAVFGSNFNTKVPTTGFSIIKQSPANNNGTTEASTTPVTTSIFGANNTTTSVFGATASKDPASNVFSTALAPSETKKVDGFSFLPTDNAASFSILAAKAPQQPAFQKDPNFSFAGAGASVFGGKKSMNAANTSAPQPKQEDTPVKNNEDEEEEGENDNAEEHDPHFEPIVPLPDAIEVRTGEEDEEKVFCQRAKLYRYVNATKEWKERGVGEMKLLHHVAQGTYRLLLRREQVHKVVCNLLLTADQEFNTLSSSDRAWCWAGMNYAEEEPALEELAVRFKNPELAAQFKDAIDKAQQALREKLNTSQANKTDESPNEKTELQTVEGDERDEDENGAGDEDEDELDEEEEEDEYSTMFEKRATLMAQEEGDAAWKTVAMGDLKVLYDHNIFGARIVLQADSTGERVSDTVICMQTEMQVNGKECTWSAIDYALEPPVKRNLKAIFSSLPVAQEMYMNFEEGQGFARESEIIEPEYYITGEE